MTYKTITYSDHARSRMKERGFSRADVRLLLATGSAVQEPHDRMSKGGMVRGKPASVIYIETAGSILIVTVMWVEG